MNENSVKLALKKFLDSFPCCRRFDVYLIPTVPWTDMRELSNHSRRSWLSKLKAADKARVTTLCFKSSPEAATPSFHSAPTSRRRGKVVSA